MVTGTAPISQERELTTIPQFNLATSLLLFAWPAAWYTLLIYGLVRLFVPPGAGEQGAGAQFGIGVMLLTHLPGLHSQGLNNITNQKTRALI